MPGRPAELAEAGAEGSRRRAAALWRSAAWRALAEQRAAEAEQCWVSLSTPTERCVRHSYDAESGVWTKTETSCKLESTPFAAGAMRECFRLLKRTQARAVAGLCYKLRADGSLLPGLYRRPT